MLNIEYNELKEKCSDCNNCILSTNRSKIVWGRGNPEAPVLFVGEAPEEQEDIIGLPLVGTSGKLLDLLLEAHEFDFKDYFITNIIKCRPPQNRIPSDEEIEKCLPFLRSQVFIQKPKIIVCLGSIVSSYLIGKKSEVTNERGIWVERKGYWIMPTYHPGELLRDNSKKIPMWYDIKKAKEKLYSSI
jgi:uracil-DNA glycosylase family 4